MMWRIKAFLHGFRGHRLATIRNSSDKVIYCFCADCDREFYSDLKG